MTLKISLHKNADCYTTLILYSSFCYAFFFNLIRALTIYMDGESVCRQIQIKIMSRYTTWGTSALSWGLVTFQGYSSTGLVELIRPFYLSRRCHGFCRDFQLPTGALRLPDYL